MFKSIQPLCHRYLLLLSVSFCVFTMTACFHDDTTCYDDNPICAAPTTIPEGEALLVCGQIIRDTDHPGAYNEPVTFSNTAEAVITLTDGDTLYDPLAGVTVEPGPFQLPLNYCITGPTAFLDKDSPYLVTAFINQGFVNHEGFIDQDGNINRDSDVLFKIGDLFLSQRIHEEDLADIYGVTLPQYDAVTPLAGLEDCTADNSQFECLIACDHPDLAHYDHCENYCTNNPLRLHCPVSPLL